MEDEENRIENKKRRRTIEKEDTYMNAYPTIKTWMSWEIQSGNFAPLCEWCISSGGRGKCCILCFIQEEKRGKKGQQIPGEMSRTA